MESSSNRGDCIIFLMPAVVANCKRNVCAHKTKSSVSSENFACWHLDFGSFLFFWCKLLKVRKLQLKYCCPTTEVYWHQWSTVPQWKYTDINGPLPHNRSILTSDINDPLSHNRTLEVYQLATQSVNGPLYHNKKYTDINSPLSHNRSILTSMIH